MGQRNDKRIIFYKYLKQCTIPHHWVFKGIFESFNVEEKQDEETFRTEQNKQKKSDAEDGYTSLYFNPDNPENDYEEVDHEKYNAIKSIRDSIMKELRKDLGRFGKPDKCGRDKTPKNLGKCVNVRPGLAMGVLTLQAGTRGERITLT